VRNREEESNTGNTKVILHAAWEATIAVLAHCSYGKKITSCELRSTYCNLRSVEDPNSGRG